MGELYDGLHNLYSLSKTLRFELIPLGKTYEHIKMGQILDADI